MLLILGTSDPFEVIQVVVLFIAVNMVCFFSGDSRTSKGLQNEKVNHSIVAVTIFAKDDHEVAGAFGEWLQLLARIGSASWLDASNLSVVRDFIPTLESFDGTPFFGKMSVAHGQSPFQAGCGLPPRHTPGRLS